jgi:major membrane immunogen (membrane-anchored lipoprotein)
VTAFHISNGVSKSFILGALMTGLALLGGCSSDSGSSGGGSSSSSSSGAPAPDTSPDQFMFTDKSDAFLATAVDSDPITVSGIDQATDISITDGEYSINEGEFTDQTQSDAVNDGDEIIVRVTSSDELDTPVEAELTIGGVSDLFTVTTRSVDAGGIYTGSGTVNGDTELQSVHGMIHNHRFMIFSVEENVLYDGEIQTYSGNEITAMVDVYKDGVNSQQATASGTVNMEDSIELTLSAADFGEGTISLNYDERYEQGASFETFQAESPFVWGGKINSVSVDISMNIKAPSDDNTFTGGSAASPASCNYANGVKTIPNENRNIYLLSFDVEQNTECNYTGTEYSGFATIVDDGDAENKKMWFAASNDLNSNFSILDWVEQ